MAQGQGCISCETVAQGQQERLMMFLFFVEIKQFIKRNQIFKEQCIELVK